MMSISTPSLNSEAFTVAEAIAAKDLNNLYLTSCHFVDRQRYYAFCGMYALMRVIDDRVDAIPDRDLQTVEERRHEHHIIDVWADLFRRHLAGEELSPSDVEACEHADAAAILEAATSSMQCFPAPWSLWRNFFDAMHADIDRSRFATYAEFLVYTEGSSVSPTTIYLYLIAAQEDEDGVYRLPADFDLIRCGRDLGTFAYLAHIVRDMASDLRTGEQGLLYLATEDLEQYGLNEDDLRADLVRRQSGDGLRRLVATLVDRARQHADRGRQLTAPVDDVLSSDCVYILELIITIYERILDKVVALDHDPMTGNHQLTMDEKQAIAREVAERCVFASE